LRARTEAELIEAVNAIPATRLAYELARVAWLRPDAWGVALKVTGIELPDKTEIGLVERIRDASLGHHIRWAGPLPRTRRPRSGPSKPKEKGSTRETLETLWPVTDAHASLAQLGEEQRRAGTWSALAEVLEIQGGRNALPSHCRRLENVAMAIDTLIYGGPEAVETMENRLRRGLCMGMLSRGDSLAAVAQARAAVEAQEGGSRATETGAPSGE
jgi:hypothetical protein